jgi:hypothetical protein
MKFFVNHAGAVVDQVNKYVGITFEVEVEGEILTITRNYFHPRVLRPYIEEPAVLWTGNFRTTSLEKILEEVNNKDALEGMTPKEIKLFTTIIKFMDKY